MLLYVFKKKSVILAESQNSLLSHVYQLGVIFSLWKPFVHLSAFVTRFVSVNTGGVYGCVCFFIT